MKWIGSLHWLNWTFAYWSYWESLTCLLKNTSFVDVQCAKIKIKTLIYPHTIYKHSKKKDQTFLKYVVLTSHYCSMLYIFNKRNVMYNIEDKVHYCKVTQNGTSHYQWITWMFQWGGIINEKILYYIKYKTKGKNWKQNSTDIALLPWPLSQPIVFYLFQYSSK